VEVPQFEEQMKVAAFS